MSSQRNMQTHRFQVGQYVRLSSLFSIAPALPTADLFQVTGTLPPRGGQPQYRIRNDNERFERVARQDDLAAEAAAESVSDDAKS